MATLSALMTMTKSPPSTLGVNVGLCLPRSSFAASTASRPSTTSVASMTYHVRVVSPAFGVYVDTALPLSLLRVDPGYPGCRSSVNLQTASATDRDPRRPKAQRPAHANVGAYLRASSQVKTRIPASAGPRLHQRTRTDRGDPCGFGS